jgi:putative transposase
MLSGHGPRRLFVVRKFCTTMKAEDVAETVNMALQASSLDQLHLVRRPRLLSDNGSSYISEGQFQDERLEL